MKSTLERAAEALDRLPEELRESAVAYLLQQGEKFRALKALVTDGMADVEAGRVSKWNVDDFLRKARGGRSK